MYNFSSPIAEFTSIRDNTDFASLHVTVYVVFPHFTAETASLLKAAAFASLRLELGDPVAGDTLLVNQLVQSIVLRRPLADDVEPVVAHAVLLVEERAWRAEEGGWAVLGVASKPQSARRAVVEYLGTNTNGIESEEE